MLGYCQIVSCTTFPSINFYSTSEYQQYPPLNNRGYAKKKKIKKLPPLKVYLQEIKLLVSYIPLFVVWFAQITILTPTDIQIKDRITSFPIKIFLRSPLLSFLLFFNPFSSALIDACVRFDARIPALPHNLILNL